MSDRVAERLHEARKALAGTVFVFGVIFLGVFAAMYFFDLPADWRTPITLGIATVCICGQLHLGFLAVATIIQINTVFALSKMGVSDEELYDEG